MSAVAQLAQDAIAMRFESEGEAWSDTESGDRLARIAVDELEYRHLLRTGRPDAPSDDLLDHATEFTFYPEQDPGIEPLTDYHSFALKVVQRGQDSWAVTDGAWCYGRRRGQRCYEPIPSSRTGRFLKAYRFTRDEAIALALKYVDKQTVNGRTAIEWQRHFAAGGKGL